MSILADSGDRRQFNSGAVRDMGSGKGRCDLMPLSVIGDYIYNSDEYRDTPSGKYISSIITEIGAYIYDGESYHIYGAIDTFCNLWGYNTISALLEVSKHYEDGCVKYGERNWEKGIPLHSYIDSGVRHLLKYVRGDSDEPHDRAFIWNMLCALWTQNRHPSLCDTPAFMKNKYDDNDSASNNDGIITVKINSDSDNSVVTTSSYSLMTSN